MKKTLIITLIIVASIALIYVGAWLYFYFVVCKPLIPKDTVAFAKEMNQYTGHQIYTYSSTEDGYSYQLFVPTFGKFSCTIQMASAFIMPTPDEIEQYGLSEEESKMHLRSGSEFVYSFRMPIGWNGKIRHVSVNINPFSEDDITKYGAGTLLLYHADGSLQNEDQLSDPERNTFLAADSEIKKVIQTAKSVFRIPA